MFRLIRILPSALSVSATGILLPLYVYPGGSASDWVVVNKAVAAYANVKWQIIVNTHSGPGTSSSSPYPSDDYIAGIEALNRYSNVQMLGYVDTGYGKRAIQDVTDDIDKYVLWANYTERDIRIDGIFFDDVPSIYDFRNHPGTDVTNETYFQSITSYACTTLTSDLIPLVCNSGNPSDPKFFHYCDTMVEFENTYADYNSHTIDSITGNGGILNQTAIIMYFVPGNLALSTLTSMISTMKSKKVQWVGLTNDCCYNALNETLLTLIAAACNDYGAVVSTSTSASMASVRTQRILLTQLLVISFMLWEYFATP